MKEKSNQATTQKQNQGEKASQGCHVGQCGHKDSSSLRLPQIWDLVSFLWCSCLFEAGSIPCE